MGFASGNEIYVCVAWFFLFLFIFLFLRVDLQL